MYQLAYAEISKDSFADCRSREQEAFDRAISLLQEAAKRNKYSLEAIAAIQYTNELWRSLLQDLASPENQLTEQLRANLINVGLWIMRETEKITNRVSLNFNGIIDIMRTVRSALA